eukprot:4370221-Pyramimonas_sp.AAC.1
MCLPVFAASNRKRIYQDPVYTRIRPPVQISAQGRKQLRCIEFGSLSPEVRALILGWSREVGGGAGEFQNPLVARDITTTFDGGPFARS